MPRPAPGSGVEDLLDQETSDLKRTESFAVQGMCEKQEGMDEQVEQKQEKEQEQTMMIPETSVEGLLDV